MTHKISLLSALLMGCCLMGCEMGEFRPEDTNGNALSVKPANAKIGTLVYPIGSVFTGGADAEPAKGSSHRSRFYREKFEKGPRWDEVEALVEIYGYHYNGIDYNEPGQVIDQIRINGLDESLGLGSSLIIPMEQGKYKGGNELIKDVRIKSYTFSSYSEGHQNKDADINIVITSTTGDIITIRFADDITPEDGYA